MGALSWRSWRIIPKVLLVSVLTTPPRDDGGDV